MGIPFALWRAASVPFEPPCNSAGKIQITILAMTIPQAAVFSRGIYERAGRAPFSRVLHHIIVSIFASGISFADATPLMWYGLLQGARGAREEKTGSQRHRRTEKKGAIGLRASLWFSFGYRWIRWRFVWVFAVGKGYMLSVSRRPHAKAGIVPSRPRRLRLIRRDVDIRKHTHSCRWRSPPSKPAGGHAFTMSGNNLFPRNQGLVLAL